MPKSADAPQGVASIYGLGTWAGGRPVLWVRAAAIAAVVGYGATATFHFFTGIAPVGDRVMELVTVTVSAVAFLLAPRRTALAAGLLIGVVSVELLVATLLVPDSQTISPLVFPNVVLAAGLFFGVRATLAAGGAIAVLYPLALALSGRFGGWLQHLGPVEVSRLLVVEFTIAAVTLMTTLAVRMLVRIHAEAEERRRLEIRLQHLQRLHVVGQLAGVAAHDFRNLLGIFQNTAQILSMTGDPATRAIGSDLLQTARSGQAITRQLLSLARREEPQRGPLDVARTVDGLRPLVTRLLGPRCALTLSSQGPAWAAADAGELEQVVLNLAANARDAMDGGGCVGIRVLSVPREEAERLGSKVDAPHQVLVEVRDQGKGIAPELHERIFEPFVTTKLRGEGTGLGLATVRSIADASGGAVTVESAPGAGACFRVFLPELLDVEPTPARSAQR
jgi:signal transduction histidine kinase